jgi:hypothetical protein
MSRLPPSPIKGDAMRVINKRVWGIAIVLCMIVTSGAFAQQEGYIEGSVFWSSRFSGNGPIANAIISVYDSLSLIGQDTTSAQGTFGFTLIPGTYYASFAKAGFYDSTLSNIMVTEAETTDVNLRLLWINNCHYFPGDVNNSHIFNGLDVIYGVSYFKGGPPPPYQCECTPGNTWYVAGDLNFSCSFNGLDIMYAVAYQGHGGPMPHGCPDCSPAP